MRKGALFPLLILIFITHSSAQNVGINNSAPDASAVLDIKSTSKGLLIPRMTTAQRTAIATPAKGLIVFDITTSSFWFHDGMAWEVLSAGSSTNYWTESSNNIFSNNTGNVGIGISTPLAKLSVQTGTGNYGIIHSDGVITVGTYVGNNEGWLGTKSNHPLTFFTNNSNEQMTLLTNGNFGIGTASPLAKLHIAGGVKIDGSNTLEFGAGIAGKEVSAGKIGYQAFGTFDALDIVGAGTGANRKIKFWNEGGAQFAGSVAVGVTDPLFIYKMDIADRIRIRSSSASSTAGIALNNSDNSAVSAFIGTKGLDLVGVYGSVSGWGLLMNTNTGAVAIGYQNPVAGYRLSVLGNQYINGLVVTTGDVEIGGRGDISGNLYVGGKIGIGGEANVPIEVFSTVNYTGNNNWTNYDNSTFSDGLLCIRGHGAFMAELFVATSDVRIKNIVGTSSSAKDLETISALKITDYTMKDKLQYGNKTFKKVIAQEVEKVYPQIVSKNVGYIPNIYAVPTKIEKTTNGYLISFNDKHTISKIAKKIQLIIGPETKQFEILSIPSENQVEIKTADLKTDKVFVYGEEVDDLRTVDYEGLTTLNISATQELSKLINAQNKKIAALEEEIKLMKATRSITMQTK